MHMHMQCVPKSSSSWIRPYYAPPNFTLLVSMSTPSSWEVITTRQCTAAGAPELAPVRFLQWVLELAAPSNPGQKGRLTEILRHLTSLFKNDAENRFQPATSAGWWERATTSCRAVVRLFDAHPALGCVDAGTLQSDLYVQAFWRDGRTVGAGTVPVTKVCWGLFFFLFWGGALDPLEQIKTLRSQAHRGCTLGMTVVRHIASGLPTAADPPKCLALIRARLGACGELQASHLDDLCPYARALISRLRFEAGALNLAR